MSDNSEKIIPLVVLPWHVNLLLGEAVYVGCKWVLPAAFSSEHFLHPITVAIAGQAWLFSGIFVVIGANTWLTGKQPKSTHGKPGVNRLARRIPMRTMRPR